MKRYLFCNTWTNQVHLTRVSMPCKSGYFETALQNLRNPEDRYMNKKKNNINDYHNKHFKSKVKYNAHPADKGSSQND